ncbi:zona pellucida protein AX 4 [Erpetoichthys calabaricus]|uniref:Uncharacterized LOC114648980 n=1 Tax=Erpetoichthys calabaricus TaxID=27687 RepID=A0A8C4SDG8_ERPCA|nr:zona pellucida protein AX 4 [Erpetoichthys calabaricus]
MVVVRWLSRMHCIMAIKHLIGITLLMAFLPAGIKTDLPPRTYTTECRDHYFWMSAAYNLNGATYRFDVLDNADIYPLTETYASQCGFTYGIDFSGNITFRASFLACHVVNNNDLSFSLQFRLVVIDQLKGESDYPFSMFCQLFSPWQAREIVCEENYMEVSVRKNVPVIGQEGRSAEDWEAALPLVDSADMMVWQIIFHKTNQPMKIMTTVAALDLGYLVNSTFSRVLLRAPYSLTESDLIELDNIEVEVVRGTILYKQRWMLLLVDTSTACSKYPADFTNENLVWLTPRIMDPLVLHVSMFTDMSLQMGIDGQVLDSLTIQSRGYLLTNESAVVNITIPYGSPGGYIQSHVINNQYNQRYSINAYLVHVWADDMWDSTRHASFIPLQTPYIPQTPFVLNETGPHDTAFTVYCGVFNSDVTLWNLTVGGQTLSVPQALDRGFEISETKYANGTHGYIVKINFIDPLIYAEYVGEGVRQYTLKINYTMSIIPQIELYYIPATIVHLVFDVVYPNSTGACTPSGFIFESSGGNLNTQWAYYVGNHELTEELAIAWGYTLILDPNLYLEVPLLSPGVVYEDISLRGIVAQFVLSLVDVATLTVESVILKRCWFPPEELLVCMPNGTITVVAVTMSTMPRVDTSKMSLLDRTCLPTEVNETFAVFSFAANTCGTIVKIKNGYLIYENEVIYNRELFPVNFPVITRDSDYRLTVRCLYPINDTLKIYAKGVPASRIRAAMRFGTYSGPKRTRDIINMKSRIAKDVTFTKFYSDLEFPVTRAPVEPLFLETELLHSNPVEHLVLKDCWATETAELDGSPQWDLVTDGCQVSDKSYAVKLLPVATNGARNPHHIKRFVINILEGPSPLWEQIYIHCSAVICDGHLSACDDLCISEDRTVRSLQTLGQQKGYVSAGPIHIHNMKPGNVKMVSGNAYKQMPILGFVAAMLGVMLIIFVIIAVKVKC